MMAVPVPPGLLVMATRYGVTNLIHWDQYHRVSACIGFCVKLPTPVEGQMDSLNDPRPRFYVGQRVRTEKGTGEIILVKSQRVQMASGVFYDHTYSLSYDDRLLPLDVDLPERLIEHLNEPAQFEAGDLVLVNLPPDVPGWDPSMVWEITAIKPDETVGMMAQITPVGGSWQVFMPVAYLLEAEPPEPFDVAVHGEIVAHNESAPNPQPEIGQGDLVRWDTEFSALASSEFIVQRLEGDLAVIRSASGGSMERTLDLTAPIDQLVLISKPVPAYPEYTNPTPPPAEDVPGTALMIVPTEASNRKVRIALWHKPGYRQMSFKRLSAANSQYAGYLTGSDPDGNGFTIWLADPNLVDRVEAAMIFMSKHK
jgi:hypothetical protein